MHLKTEAGILLIAHWTKVCRNSTLTLFVGKNQSIPANEMVEVTIPSAFGLRIPAHGVPATMSGMLISARVIDVHILPAPFTNVQLIGSIVSSVLLYDPPKADTMIEMSLNMVVRMDLRQHDLILLSLPDFQGPSSNITADFVTGGADTMAFASWTNTTQTLTFTVPLFISRHTAFQAILPSSNSILLPVKGVKASQMSLDVSITAVTGSIPDTTIQESPPVGSYTNSTKLVFDQGEKAAEVTMFNLSFTAEMDILENETLTLTLPGFTHKASWNTRTCNDNCSLSYGHFRTFTWLALEEQLVLTVRTRVNANTIMFASLGRDVGIALPFRGLRQNQASIMIGTDARDGPVLPTSIVSIQPVGSLTNSSRLLYSPGKAGQVSNITISLRPEMSFVPGDTVHVFLENFTRYLLLDVPVITTPPAIIGPISWNQSTFILSMPLISNVSRATEITFKILETAGIALPERGIRHDSSGQQIRTDAQRGPMPWTVFAHSPPVGTFFNTSALHFGLGAVAGLPCNVSFSAQPVMPFLGGESIVLYLPGFVGSRLVYEMPILGTVFSSALWNATQPMNSSQAPRVPTLSIVFGNATQALVYIEFLLPCSFGLRLPLDGVRSNQTSLMASTEASLGPMVQTAIITTQPIGSFLDSPTIHFEPARAGQIASITVSFTHQMPLVVGDIISVYLPHFQGSTDKIVHAFDGSGTLTNVSVHDGNRTLTSVPHGLFTTGSWFVGKGLLTITVAMDLAAQENVTINIGETFKISLPETGVRLNQATIQIEADAQFGGVLPTSFSVVQVVGSFTNSTSLGFVPAQANTACNIILIFTAEMKIMPGEELILELPGFLGNAFRNLSLDDGGNFSLVSWSGVETQKLVLTVDSEISPGFQQQVTVPLAAGVRVPLNGTLKNDPGIKISVDAYYGPVLPTSIVRSPPIGSMLATPQLKFNNLKPDGTAQIIISFRPNMEIWAAGTVVLDLPGFRGESSDCLAPDDISAISVASWNSPTLVLTLARSIKRNETIVISFPTNSGLRLPFNGIRKDEHTFTIETNSTDSPLIPTSIASTQAVGSVTFEGNAGRLATRLNSTAFQLAESASFSREGYKSNTLVIFFDGPGSAHEEKEIIHYGGSDQTVLLEGGFGSVRLKTVGVANSLIKDALGVYVPAYGTGNAPLYNMTLGSYFLYNVSGHNDECPQAWAVSERPHILRNRFKSTEWVLWACSNAASPAQILNESAWYFNNGTQVTSLPNMIALSPFSKDSTYQVAPRLEPSLSYWIPDSKNTHKITFQIVPHMSLQTGDTVTLKLSGFRYCKRRCRAVSILADGEFVTYLRFSETTQTTATWSKQASTLVIPLQGSIKAFDVLSIEVSSTNDQGRALWTPNYILENDPSLQFKIDASSGSIPFTSISISPPQGYFATKPQVSFDPPVAGSATEIKVKTSVLYTREVSGDTRNILILDLPGFSGPVKSIRVPGLAEYTSIPGDSGVTVQILILRPLFVRELTEFVVPISMGIRLPPDGVPPNGGGITLEAEGFQAAVDATIVGALRSSTVSFSPAGAGVPVNITISVTSSSIVRAYERIYIRLPGFKRGPFGEQSVDGMLIGLVGPDGYLFNAYWSSAESTIELEIVCGKNMSAFQRVDVILPSSAGIHAHLPA